MRIHHIGYAVKSIEKSIGRFDKLGYCCVGDIIKDYERNINILFIKNDNYLIELVEAVNENSPISNILKKVGNNPYHICYETDDIHSTIEKLKKEKFILVEDIKEAPAIENRNVAFLFNKDIGLIELVEY